MKLLQKLLSLATLLCCSASAQQSNLLKSPVPVGVLQQDFFADFNLNRAAADAEQFLSAHPGDVTALFIRMETAALQQHTDVVLDSALRLCSMPAPDQIQEIASSRILEHAANSRVFNEVVRRVGLAMDRGGACTFNLRLALVGAAADGTPRLDMDKTAQSAGLLTRWKIAGPFGKFSNVDFEKTWPAENARFWTEANADVEQFLFRDGMVFLPEYLSGPGVFYATSQVRTDAGRLSQLDVLSPGPYTIFVDGRRKLEKDSRMTAAGNRESVQLQFGPGKHTILVKFTADAAPFSLDLHPQFGRSPQTMPATAGTELREYTQILASYFRGDLNRVAHGLSEHKEEAGGPWLYLRALLWSAAEERSPRVHAAWKALAKAEPSASLAAIKAAEFALPDHVTDDVRAEVSRLMRQLPESELSAQLALDMARHDGSGIEPAFNHLLELHPSCNRLAEALQFAALSGETDRTRDMAGRLQACAPESLDYSRTLVEAGKHREAIVAVEEKLARNPLNRSARRLLVQELVLAGESTAAAREAKQLAAIARHSRAFAAMAADPALVLNSKSSRALSFVTGRDFYTPYRREGTVIAAASRLPLPASSSALLLQDRVVQIADDGGASVYTHRVRRLANKEAVTRYGQVAIPRDADLLELRTIKANGQIVEPDSTQNKGAISMAALEPGDSVEEEYVVHYTDWAQMPPEASLFEFGSVTAPVVSSRFVVIAPRDTKIPCVELNGAGHPRIESTGAEIIRSWSADNLPAVREEPFARAGDLLPSVAIMVTDNALDRARDTEIEATRIGPHVMETVAAQPRSSALSQREKARKLYRFVTTRIESTGPALETSTAEDSLANREGSRTATLLALARASGLNAALLLARPLERRCPEEMSRACYSEPLVRFYFGTETVDVDVETDDLPFGTISSAVDSEHALLVPLQGGATPKPELVAVISRPSQQRSIGEGDLFLHSDGNLAAMIHLRLGADRGREIRAALRKGTDHQRQTFFDQFAARILPGAINVHGDAINVTNADEPLELEVSCTVPQFMLAQNGMKSIGQLAPVLGLPGSLASTASRRSALYLDTPFSESTVFHLHLPPGFSTLALPQDFSTRSEFGSYSVQFSWSAGQLNVKREFDIPAQAVEPDGFPAFAEFVRGINAAEHQQINLVFHDADLRESGKKQTHASVMATQ